MDTRNKFHHVLAINVTGVNGSTIVYEPAGTLISYWLGTLHPYGDFAVYSVREFTPNPPEENYGVVLDQRSSINLLLFWL